MKDTTVDKTACAAFGCPCAATASNGGSTWLCTYHFGTEATSWQRITLELRRLEWLILVCRGIRVCYGTEKWENASRKMDHDIRMHQRTDLLFSPEKDGNPQAWLRRLESVIANAAAGARQPQLATVA
ncbi:hypothetical protein Herbaro_09320 [Herbaspirillum sp. WKF16]|uniref:hypothetical protein n=1 Tax=Herbaspirillum sp. WKF16 TaxID=3028312 RepID=UPI0023A99801|nr:hypothetical protein [Herbaspirillum sp. WKF16]WDZ97960.1 hypothetical protein Herbaro_09320 [Herbaspirillum sp. WKF16]